MSRRAGFVPDATQVLTHTSPAKLAHLPPLPLAEPAVASAGGGGPDGGPAAAEELRWAGEVPHPGQYRAPALTQLRLLVASAMADMVEVGRPLRVHGEG